MTVGEPVTHNFTKQTNVSRPANYPFLSTDPIWAEVYAPNGTLLKEGDIVYRKKFADTLELSVSATLFPSLALNSRS